MHHWFMVTLVGQDQIGIVSKITTALYQGGCNLGEASMLRLGGNFSIMMMVDIPTGGKNALTHLLQPVAEELQLHLHLDAIEGLLHHHQVPNVRVSVHGADRAGIVAQVTSVLANAGLNILELESDVGGNVNQPFYLMHIEGVATAGMPALEEALRGLFASQSDLKVTLEPIETVVM